jgi:hypothetical protein
MLMAEAQNNPHAFDFAPDRFDRLSAAITAVGAFTGTPGPGVKPAVNTPTHLYNYFPGDGKYTYPQMR